MTEFSARLREARKNSGLKVPEVLAQLKEKGVSISDKTLYNWETGARTPDADEFIKLCRVYKLKSFKEFESAEIEETPVPEGTEAISRELSDRLYGALVASGLIVEDDLVAEDIRFLGCVVDLILDWFNRKKAE